MEGLPQHLQSRTESPERLLEEGKNPGLGIRRLHEQGITGKGVVVGIIDQRISPTHTEFKDAVVSNKEYYTPQSADDTEVSMHGPAVVSLFVGKECGVAPDTKVVYGNTNMATDGFIGVARALKDILEYNTQHEPKIRIVSVSKGYMESSEERIPGLDEWIEAKKEAVASGVTIIDSNYFEEHNITGGGSKHTKDSFDDYDVPLFYKDPDRQFSNVEDVERKVSSLPETYQKEFFKKYTTYQGFLGEYAKSRKEELIVPCDYRTMASQEGDDAFRYEEKGGLSWAIPYLAGVFALASQVQPGLSNEEFLHIVKKTAGKNREGIEVINPSGIIEEVKKMDRSRAEK